MLCLISPPKLLVRLGLPVQMPGSWLRFARRDGVLHALKPELTVSLQNHQVMLLTIAEGIAMSVAMQEAEEKDYANHSRISAKIQSAACK